MARTARAPAEVQFGQRLRSLLVQSRTDRQMSVRQVAAAIGASPHGLYAVEAGRVLSPGFRTVHLLAGHYGLDLTDLARRAEVDR